MKPKNVVVLSRANETWLLVASWLPILPRWTFFWVWFEGLGTILPFSPSCSVRRSGCGSGMCPNLGPFIQGSRSHSSQSWLRCPDSATPSPSYSSLSPSDKIWMSESRNTNKSHCPLLCPWITGFLLHIFGDFISKAVWISLVGEISPIWPGAWCARLIPDREPPGTHVDADSIFAARKSDEYRSHCDAIAHWWVEVGRRRSSSQSVSRRQPRVIMLTSPRAEVRVTQAMHLIGPLTKISHLQAYFPKAT